MTYTEEGVRALLWREGFRQVTARPLHPRADGAAQGAFRDRFASLVRDTVGVRAAPLEVWFQGEARVGQKGTLSRIWARKGDRPRIARDHRYRYRYLFGAACGALGKAVGLVAERANTAAMNAHLAAIAAAVTEGSHGLVVLDQAGWHKSKDLSVPDNLTLLLLPPYSPELNPMETVFQFLKGNRLSNRVFADEADIADACRKAWDWFEASPDNIASIMRQKWGSKPQHA